MTAQEEVEKRAELWQPEVGEECAGDLSFDRCALQSRARTQVKAAAAIFTCSAREARVAVTVQ